MFKGHGKKGCKIRHGHMISHITTASHTDGSSGSNWGHKSKITQFMAQIHAVWNASTGLLRAYYKHASTFDGLNADSREYIQNKVSAVKLGSFIKFIFPFTVHYSSII